MERFAKIVAKRFIFMFDSFLNTPLKCINQVGKQRAKFYTERWDPEAWCKDKKRKDRNKKNEKKICHGQIFDIGIL